MKNKSPKRSDESSFAITVDLMGHIDGPSVHDDANLQGLSNLISDLNVAVPKNLIGVITTKLTDALDQAVTNHGESIFKKGLKLDIGVKKVNEEIVLSFDLKLAKSDDN